MKIPSRLKRIIVFPALGLTLLLGGCGALPVSVAALIPVFVSAGGGGVAYTVTSVAYQTFSYSFEEVDGAVHSALKKMEIGEFGSEEFEDGLEISAATKKLKIYVTLEKITPATTKVKVNAKRGTFLKDKATAKEILVQVGRALEPNGMQNGAQPRQTPSPSPPSPSSPPSGDTPPQE